MTDNSYYDRLGVDRSADSDTIRRAYRKLAKEFHPDKNPNKIEEYTQKFKDLSEAYSVLSDPDKRIIYDRCGKEGLQQGGGMDSPFNGMSFNFGNMFKNFFGMSDESDDDSDELQIVQETTLDELYTGKQYTRRIKRKCLCKKCNGSGSNDGIDYTCKQCDGKKVCIKIIRLGPMVQHIQTPCGNCGSRGYMKNFVKCVSCNGSKHEHEQYDFKFNIPPGSTNRQIIEIENEGHEILQNSKKRRGNIKVMITEKKHNMFTRYFNCDNIMDPSNLLMKLDITLCESLIGFSKNIKFLNNTELCITKNDITKQDAIHIIPNKGMPRQNHPNQYGNLYIQYNIQYPVSFSEDTKKKIKEILC